MGGFACVPGPALASFAGTLSFGLVLRIGACPPVIETVPGPGTVQRVNGRGDAGLETVCCSPVSTGPDFQSAGSSKMTSRHEPCAGTAGRDPKRHLRDDKVCGIAGNAEERDILKRDDAPAAR